MPLSRPFHCALPQNSLSKIPRPTMGQSHLFILNSNFSCEKGLVIWHGNESTQLCGLLVLLNILSFPTNFLFFVERMLSKTNIHTIVWIHIKRDLNPGPKSRSRSSSPLLHCPTPSKPSHKYFIPQAK